MKSIKTKLIVSFSILILVITLIIGIFSLVNSYTSLKKEVQNSLQLMAEEGAKLTESRMDNLINTLEMVAKKKELINMGWEVDLNILEEELDKTDFLDIGYVLLNGYTYYTDGTVSLMSDRVYIQSALSGKSKVSDIIISRVTRKPEIEISVPIIKNGQIVGALVGRKEADALGKITKDGGYGENGFAFMINGEGTMIAHPDTDKIISHYNPLINAENDFKQESLAQAVSSMLQMKKGITQYHMENINFYVGYAPVSGTEWIFAITADEHEIMSAMPKLIKMILTLMIIVLIISIGFVYGLDHTITKPVIEITKYSKRIANLDIGLNLSQKFLKQKDEIGLLSEGFQTLSIKLREIIKEISTTTYQVTITARELSAASQQSAAVSEEISKTVGDIARGAAEQAEFSDIGSTQAARLGILIEKNQEIMNCMNSISYEVMELVNSGLAGIDRLEVITKENIIATKDICDIIMQTSASSKQISEASKVISEMSSQTNLLALNASIEAARAGDAGKGFAVVAEEIQKMADQSAVSTKYIDKIISVLQTNIDKAVKSMEQIKVTSEGQKKSVVETIQKYQSIAASIEVSTDAVKELNSSQKNMLEVKNEILLMLQSLSSIAEKNATGTQQAASTMEEQNTTSRELARASIHLSDMASGLKAITDRFKV